MTAGLRLARAAGAALLVLAAAAPAAAQAAGGFATQRAPAPRGAAATIAPRGTIASASAFDRMAAIARRDGTVRVIAGLQVRFVPEGTLSAGARGTQRSSIASAATAMRRVLRGTGFSTNRT